MAKKPNLGQMTNLNVSQINTAFSRIEESFENTLSRDGSTPNNMAADLDMDSNDILNAANVSAQTITVETAIIGGKEFAGTITWRASWLTGTAYEYLDLVNKDGVLYICLEAHTSDTFMTDLTNDKWEVFISNTTGPTGDAGADGQGVPTGGTTGQVLAKVDNTDYNTEWVDAGSGGVTDHGALTGLGDDDHSQYHNDARGDARYYTKTQLDSGQLDTRYFTESEVTTALSGKADTSHTHSIANVTGLQTALDGKQASGSYAAATHTHVISDVTGLQTALDGKQAAGSYAAASHTHTLANVTDVTITVANLNTLDDGANTTLHFHDSDRNRANHTGTQLASTISDFATAVAATAAVTANTAKVSNATHTGDVTGSTALTIANDVVTNAKLANVATATIKGRTTAGTGDPEDLTGTQATALLDTFTSGAKGLAPASGGGTTNFLRADGTWAAPAGGGGGSGDVVGPSSATDNALVRFDTTTGKLIQNSGVTLDDNGVATLPAANTPSSPSTDQISLYAKRIGRVYPSFIGQVGLEDTLQPSIARAHVALWYPQGSNTTVVNLGLTPSFTGTAAAQTVATTSFWTMCKRIAYQITTPATNAVANWRAASQQFTIGGTRAGEGGFSTTIRCGPSTGVSTSTTRFFAGMRYDGNAASDSNPSSITNLGVGFGWDSGDTNCQIIHRGAGSATKIDLGSSFPRPSVDQTDVFEINLYSPPGTTQEVYYTVKKLNTGVEASGLITTNLPSTSTFGSPHVYMSVGGTSSVVGIAIMKVMVESNF